MHSRTSLLALVLALAACPAPSRSSAPPAAVTAELDADERAVIATVLNRSLGSRPFIVISDSTFTRGADPGWVGYVRQQIGIPETVMDEMVRDYSNRNRVRYALPADLPTARPARIFPYNEFRRWGDLDKFRELQRTLPGATSYHMVSRPGFDAARRTAMLYAVIICPGLCAQGSVVVVRREGRSWRVQGVAVLVVT